MLLGYDQLRVPYLISRRSFGKLLAAAPFSSAFAGEHNMCLSLNSVLLQGRVHWPDFARLAARIGFPGTDIMLGATMQTGVNATNDLLAGLKIRPAVVDFPVEFRKDDATFNASLTQLDAAAQFAAAIHCPRMITYIMPSSDTPRDELRQTYKQRLAKGARILARSNVRLGLEFLGPLELRRAHKYEFIWRMNPSIMLRAE
jgi:sugar phosphate isomerase/epimerase